MTTSTATTTTTAVTNYNYYMLHAFTSHDTATQLLQ